MNKVILMGRTTDAPNVSYANTSNGQLAIAKYTLAVDRMGKDAGTDFIRCVAFGKNAEFAEKYISKGLKIAIEGRIQTGSYEDKDGKKVYTTDVIIDRQEFCEKKSSESAPASATSEQMNSFMNIPDGMEEELPFN